MKRLIITAGALIGLLCSVGLGQAVNDKNKDKETKAPAVKTVQAKPAAKTDDGVLAVTVTGVSGSAEVRESPDKPWRAVTVGDNYSEGAEIRTGYRSQVDLKFSDNSKMTVNRVSHFRVDKFTRAGNMVVTRSHLSYGKIRAGVEKGPELSDYKITTSLGTLGVNGTRDIYLYVDPGIGVANICLTEQGKIGWNKGSGSDVSVHPQGCTNQNGIGEDARKLQVNNITLVDPFGSNDTEHNVGDNYGNQGNNSQGGTPGNNIISNTHDWHYKDGLEN